MQEGILPVFLVITNDGDKPISVTKLQAQLVTANRSKLDGIGVEDVMRRVGHVNASSTSPGKITPFPIPGAGGNKNKKAQQQLEEVNRARFSAFAVEPHSTQSGFLFFDIENVRNPVKGAHIYITGVRDAGGTELMYFDIAVLPSAIPAATEVRDGRSCSNGRLAVTDLLDSPPPWNITSQSHLIERTPAS